MSRSSSFLRAAAAGFLALGLAACSGAGDDADLLAAGAGGAGAGGGGFGAAGSLDPTSVEYFQITVGDRVFFDTDSAQLSSDAQAVLRAQAQWLGANPADERGTREYNLALGARRAAAARSYLLAEGVDALRLRSVTFGKERPEAVCSTPSCWSQNRRSVTVMAGSGPMS